MSSPSTRTAALRMAIILASVCALDITVVALSDHPLIWARWIPGLVPILTPLAIWELFRDPSKTAK